MTHPSIQGGEASHSFDQAKASDKKPEAAIDALADAREAARYRWLRDEGSLYWVPFQSQWKMSAGQCDSAIDLEIRRVATGEQA